MQQSFKESVDDYLAFCKERGEEAEKPLSGRFMIRISPEQHRRMLLAAEKSGKDLDDWVSKVLDQASAGLILK